VIDDCVKNYLREQPDNIKSFNIVGETAQFVNLVYSNINSQNIDLCIQLFETLNEFTVVRYTAFTLLMPWLHAPIFSSDVSDFLVWEAQTRKSVRLATAEGVTITWQNRLIEQE